MPAVVKLYFHDACFDGTASAALFSAFYRDTIAPLARIEPIGMIHCDGDPFAGEVFGGDDHACVDFRYTARPELRWWFDHHRTAFQPPALRDAFNADRSGTKFFDPDAPSCAGLMAVVLPRVFGWVVPAHLRDLAQVADVIDAARFASADEAVALTAPGQQLALWIARNRDAAATVRYIDTLSRIGIAETARLPWLADGVALLARERDASRDRIDGLAEVHGDVVVFDQLDLAGSLAASNPGFVGYQLFPRCLYTIALMRGDRAIKISVGFNPWCGAPRGHDIGALCESLGGGGHAAVGGVTLRLDEVARARAAVAQMLSVLTS